MPDNKKDNTEKKPKTLFKNKAQQDIIIASILILIGLIIFLLGLIGINIFSPLVNIILTLIILLGGAYYLYKEYKEQPPTEQQLVSTPVATLQRQLTEHRNVHQLNQYVATLLQRGKKEQEIKNLCKTAGWSEKEINEALEKAKKTPQKDGLVQLETYIKTQLTKGRSTQDIQNTLQKAGWKKETVESLLTKNKPAKK